MKRFLLLFSCLFLAVSYMGAQSFDDDFESYPVNAYIAQSSPNWFTWSANGAGTTEDARVSTEQAFSGTQSLKLNSTATGGGPADIILPFGQAYTSGTLTYGMKMYVVGGTGAYFNFQANQVVGQVWAADFYLRPSGILEMSTGATSQGTAAFAHDEWLDILCIIDLTNNNWTIQLNGDVVASFSNPNNRIASLNLYPVNPQGTSTYYVDDVFYNYEPFIKPDKDLSLFGVVSKPRNIVGYFQPIQITLRNLGLETIQSVDVQWTNGSEIYTDELVDLNLASDMDYTYPHSEGIEVIGGTTDFTVSISNINGAEDDNPNNDIRELSVLGVVPAAHKMVVAEEGTGTWCGWCPRGTVLMDYMAHDYERHFIPIAVHNGDPMVNADYNGGVSTFPGFSGYPGVIMERFQVIDPLGLENTFYNYIETLPSGKLFNGAAYDEATRELTISVTTELLSTVIGNWKLNLVITEDGVTGGQGYAQSNFYAGGGNGPMGGYESLPNPVPANMMVYDHVARAILGGFIGESGSVPTPAAAGNSFVKTYTWIVPDNVNVDNLHIISMLHMPSGRINNANTVTFEEAIANGLASSNELPVSLTTLDIFPNPAAEFTIVDLALPAPSNISIVINDLLGRTVFEQNFGVITGEQQIQVPTHHLNNGLYALQIITGDGRTTRSLVIQR